MKAAKKARPMSLREINAKRKVAGVCRHCGGTVPCWSPYGDVRVGVRHPR